MIFSRLALLGAVAVAAVAAQEDAKKKHHHGGGGGKGGQTVYEMLVGATDASTGAQIQGYFPNSITVQVGDAVNFVANSLEIHTASFMGGRQVPDIFVHVPGGAPTALMMNPDVAFASQPSGGSFAGGVGAYFNTGLMALVPGFGTEYNVTFTAAGTYQGLCQVHAQTMLFTINVIAGKPKMTPKQVSAMGKAQAAKAIKQASAGYKAVAKANTWASEPIAGGGTLHYVLMGGMTMIGSMKSQIMVDYNAYFPKTLTVKNGDKIKVVQAPNNPDVPHTFSFPAKGSMPPSLVIPVPQKAGPPYLTINAAVAAPSSNVGKPYDGTTYFNSGILNPHQNFTFTVGFTGEVDWLCLVHPYMGGKLTSA